MPSAPKSLPRTLSALLMCAVVLLACASEGSGSSFSGTGNGSFPTDAARPAPNQNTFNGCPSQGDGGDPDLNVRKNRTDNGENGVFHDVDFNTLLNLPWPQGSAFGHRSTWSSSDTQAIAQYEGVAVRTTGYILMVRHEGPESTNCHSVDDKDYHMWLAANSSDDRTSAIVVEVTPRMLAKRTGWQSGVESLAGQHVRISGWLLFDQEHPDQVGQTRGTIWEIHPIIHIEVENGGTWTSFD